MQPSSPLRDIGWLTERPIAHRGLHDAAAGVIENTRSAFAAAIAGGYAIECDLQLSRDGEAMVFHDETLDRLMAGQGPVTARSVAELQALAFKGGPDRIQTLSELLSQVRGQVPLVIEIKSLWDGNAGLVRRTIEVVAGYEGALTLMSFDPKVVAMLKAEAPQILRGIVADGVTDPEYDMLPAEERDRLRDLAYLSEITPDFISYHWRDLPHPAVAQFRASGRPVITWTIRSRHDAATALRYCDQITFEGFSA